MAFVYPPSPICHWPQTKTEYIQKRQRLRATLLECSAELKLLDAYFPGAKKHRQHRREMISEHLVELILTSHQGESEAMAGSCFMSLSRVSTSFGKCRGNLHQLFKLKCYYLVKTLEP